MPSSSNEYYDRNGDARRSSSRRQQEEPRHSSSRNRPERSSSRSRQQISDDEYARQLQEQYRQDFLARQARKQSVARATAPPAIIGMPVQTTQPIQPPTMIAVPPPEDEEEIEVSLPFDEDARYARQLQAEIEREERLLEAARRSNANQRQSSARYEITPVVNSAPPLRVGNYDDDDEDARLAQQLQDEELAYRLANEAPTPRGPSNNRYSSSSVPAFVVPTSSDYPNEPYRNSSNNKFRHVPSNTRTASTDSDTSSDLAARRIAQELHDAEMAQRLAMYEEEAESRRTAQRSAQQDRQGRFGRVLVGRILPLLCCGTAVAIALLFILGVFDPQDIPVVGDRLGGNGWIDPFAGDTVGSDGSTPTVNENDKTAWPTDGRTGISLEILNALEDKWQGYFTTAVQNWDNGSPIDSLTLTTTRIGYEVECFAVTGKLKVCNANYGDTKWRGINEIMLNSRTNEIVSSAAKMNEFYLQNESEDQKLYTMCHEMGHGFGLPHWDENFFNKDLGNCMDYTNNPGDNKTPDATNFEYLAQLYGGMNVTSGQYISADQAAAVYGATGPSTTATTTNVGGVDDDDDSTMQTQDPQGGAPPKDNGGPGERRMLPADFVSAYGLDNRHLLRSKDWERSTSLSQHLLNEDSSRGRRRRIVQANDYFEVHQVVDEHDKRLQDKDMVKLEFYLLSRT